MGSLERDKLFELSLYELNRRPQKAPTDDMEITVGQHSLHCEFKCAICLDILSKTMTTKTCLHRFCSECIISALRLGNKECPTCRLDPNFDSLISHIYPSDDGNLIPRFFSVHI